MKLNGKTVINVQVEGVDFHDYPDFCDAFFSYAEFEDGVELTDEELDVLTEEYGDVLNEMAQGNLGIRALPLKPGSYWKTITVPGMVVDRPGFSDRGVVAPATGIVRLFEVSTLRACAAMSSGPSVSCA